MLEGRREDFEEGMLGGFGAVKQQRPPALLIEGRRRGDGREEEEEKGKSDDGGGMDLRVAGVARTRRRSEEIRETRPAMLSYGVGRTSFWLGR
jgi:hypothetical protein